MIGFGNYHEFTEEDKIMRMYELVHGKMDGRTGCGVEIAYDNDGYTPIGVDLGKMNDEGTGTNVFQHITKSELLFDFITKDWEHDDELGRDLQRSRLV